MRILVGMAIAVVAMIVLSPRVAAADTMVANPTISITLQATASDDLGGAYVGTRTPTFLIELLYAGPTVQCSMDDAGDASCGASFTLGCPAVQCWTYTPTLSSDGAHELTVDFDDPREVPGYENLPFVVDTTMPGTALNTPPSPDFDLLPFNRANARPVFDFKAIDDAGEEDSFQCSLTVKRTSPGPWRACATDVPWRHLRLARTYTFSVRTVDILGRADPTPPQYTFSPTPCRPRVLGKIRTLRQIVRRGLRVRVSCIQPGPVRLSLELSLGTVKRLHLPSQLLGSARGRTRRQGQAIVIKLHTLRHLPRRLFELSRLRLSVSATETAAGASDYGDSGYAYGAPGTYALRLRR